MSRFGARWQGASRGLLPGHRPLAIAWLLWTVHHHKLHPTERVWGWLRLLGLRYQLRSVPLACSLVLARL